MNRFWMSVAMMALAGAMPAKAAVFTVTNTLDSGPGSLRAALQEASSGGASHEVKFDDTYPLGGVITLSSPLPALTISALTINGNQRLPRISGAGSFPVLRTESGMRNLTLSGVQLEQGFNDVDGQGGCLSGQSSVSVNAYLTLVKTQFSDCVAQGDDVARGGAVYWVGEQVKVSDSAFVDNTALAASVGTTSRADGGAIFTNGWLDVERSRFFENHVNAAESSGGAIAVSKRARIYDSLFDGNEATGTGTPGSLGGAVSVDCDDYCPLVVQRSFFHRNRASMGGAISYYSASSSSPLIFDSNSFHLNVASVRGAALSLENGRIDLLHNTFSQNVAPAGEAADLLLVGAGLQIVANNVFAPPQSGLGCVGTSSVPAQSTGGNYAAHVDCASIGAFVHVPDMLPPLMDTTQGMPALVFPLNSPVIKGGLPAQCTPLDIRRNARPSDGFSVCDAGAYEHPPIIFADGFEQTSSPLL